MGGIRLIEKICNRCKTIYNGIHNQQLCNVCKLQGFDRICKNCNIEFISKHRYTSHCSTCKELKVWKIGKFPERGVQISISKKAFFQSNKGKEVASKVGIINSKKMKEYLQTDIGIQSLKNRAKKISATMKQKIADGTFTPVITNTFTHWDAVIEVGTETKKFRSSWEACIWFSNQHWEYEKIRIKYKGTDNKCHVYIVDFFDPINNILYEIKPNCHIKDSKLKIKAAEEYCKENQIIFKLISENELINYINPVIFTGANKKQLDKCLK